MNNSDGYSKFSIKSGVNMDNMKNSTLLKSVLKALYTVAGRRTSSRLADKTIGTCVKTLEETYDFLKYVQIENQTASGNTFDVDVSSAIDYVEPDRIGKAIESMIRVVYTDLDEDAGLYFISELKKYAGDEITSEIINHDVDLAQLQVEQHHFFKRLERKKTLSGENGPDSEKEVVNTLGYTWSNVSSWKHEPGSNYCTLYDKQGNVMDKLNLDTIIQSYVEKLSGYSGALPGEYEDKINVYEKEYKLLELMYSQDMDAESAAATLHITEEELNQMIQKLTKIEMLQYISYDVVELTDAGLSYLSKKEEKKK